MKTLVGEKKGYAAQWCLTALALGLGVAGCAATGDGSSPAAMAGEPEKVVAELAAARWDALIKRDFPKAYAYLSPGTRDRLSLQAYSDRIRGGSWKKASVDSVSCKRDQCNVQVALEYSYRDMKSIETRLNENWLQQDGKWWFVPQK